MTDPISPSITEVANATKTLADAAQVLQATEAARQKSQIDLDSARADLDMKRSTAEIARRKDEIATESDAAELEGKRLANAKLSFENDAARTDKLVQQISSAIPDLSSIPKNSVTVSTGPVMLESALTSEVIDEVSRAIADELKVPLEEPSKVAFVLITANPQLLPAMVLYRQIEAEVTALQGLLDNASEEARQALPPIGTVPTGAAGFAGAGIVVGAAIGAAAKQAASLFEVDLHAAVNNSDVAALDLQVAVAHRLHAANPGLDLRHEFVRIATEPSQLLNSTTRVRKCDLELAVASKKLEIHIVSLGDPDGEINKLKEQLLKAKTPTEKSAIRDKITDAQQDLRRLSDATQAKAGADAAIEKADAFLTRIAAVPEGRTAGPLADAVAVEPLLADTGQEPRPYVLVLPAAEAQSTQVVVSRRILWPRMMTTTTVTGRYLLLCGETVLAMNRIARSKRDRRKIGKSYKTDRD